MRISDLYRARRPVLSIELFPPKTDRGRDNLLAWLAELDRYHPGFVSVTYGAGGSTRQGTHDLCVYIKRHLHTECVAHLTCVAHTRDHIAEILEALEAEGIENLMALRGDPPRETGGFVPPPGGFAHAVELVRELAAGGRFGIGVAGYPEGHVEAESYRTDLARQVEKVQAGADVIVSQFFLDNRHFLRWRDDLRRAGVTVPVVAGILPAQSLQQIERFAGFCGVEIPGTLREALAAAGTDAAAAAAAGLAHAVEQVKGLISAGVDGIHLYALNKLAPVEAIAPLVAAAAGTQVQGAAG